MSELTTEEIEQMRGVVRKCIFGIPDSEGRIARDTLDKIVDELLSLRTDAGDEAEQLRVQLAGCLCAAEGATNDPANQGDYGWSLPYQKTLELHQQLRSAREEIERLKERVSKIRKLDDISEEQFAEDVKGSFEENSKYIDGDIEDPSVFKIYDLGYRIGFGSAMGLSDFEEGYFSGVESLQSQIATLTAERDEARKEVEQLRMAVGCATTIKGDMVMRADDPIGMMQEVCSYVASLRSCPEMGEVDALVESYSFSSSRQGCKEKFLELADLARRYAVALTEEKQRADEAERLLEMAANMAWEDMCFHAEHGDEDAAKILAICGKGVG